MLTANAKIRISGRSNISGSFHIGPPVLIDGKKKFSWSFTADSFFQNTIDSDFFCDSEEDCVNSFREHMGSVDTEVGKIDKNRDKDDTRISDAFEAIALEVARNPPSKDPYDIAKQTLFNVAVMIDGSSDWAGISGPLNIEFDHEGHEGDKSLTGRFHIHDQFKTWIKR